MTTPDPQALAPTADGHAVSDEDLLRILQGLDSTAVRLPLGFREFARRAIDADRKARALPAAAPSAGTVDDPTSVERAQMLMKWACEFRDAPVTEFPEAYRRLFDAMKLALRQAAL